MKIFVGGSFSRVKDEAEAQEFVAALGREIVAQGHILYNGCRSSLDAVIAKSAETWLKKNKKDPRVQIISYCLKGQKRTHSCGHIQGSKLSSWEMVGMKLELPEQIQKAQVAVFVGGSHGTFSARSWVFWSRKPVLGIPRFGGAGEKIYYQELERRERKSEMAAAEYERLNTLHDEMSAQVREVVNLAELLVTPREVFPILSYKAMYRDISDSFSKVCKKHKFVVQRTDDAHTSERILPRIQNEIRHSAFVIADVTDISRNVFYEIGFATGLGKEVILTAKEGTKLPFDLVDVPLITWASQTDLRNKLSRRVAAIRQARDLNERLENDI